MKKKKHKITSYEDLIAGHYGGFHKEHKQKKYGPGNVVLAKSFDNGEVLVQQPADNTYSEYVVQSSVLGTDMEEYVVQNSLWSSQYADEIKYEMVPPSKGNAQQEWQVDLLNPLQEPAANSGRPTTDIDTLFGAAKSMETPSLSPELITGDQPKLKATDADFLADMQSILSGQTVYDPTLKKTISKDMIGKQQQAYSPAPAANNNPNPPAEFKNEHAIFDRIAQSMQYANAYDLGTMELENRFSNFDRIFDQKNKAEASKSAGSAKSDQLSAEDATVTSTDFIQDLDAIKKQSLYNTPSPENETGLRKDEPVAANAEQANISYSKIVIPPDERTAVPNTLIAPYRWVCRIEPVFKHPDTGNEMPFDPGTGTLVGPRHILTAAHVIENFIDTRVTHQHQWQKAIKVKITPGSNGTTHTPFGTYETDAFLIPPNWSSTKNVDNRHNDYAMIVLKEDISTKKFGTIGNDPLGYFSDITHGAGTHFTTMVPQMVKDVLVETAGYPHDIPAVQLGRQWRSTGSIQTFPNDDPVFLHTMDTEKGQSGSPIWKDDAGKKYLIGIHNGSIATPSGPRNFGVMMTANIINQVVKWRS